MPTLNIPESELPQIEWFARLSDENFSKLVSAFRDTDPTLTLREFSEAVSEKIDLLPPDEVEENLKTLFALYWLKERSGYPTDVFAEDLAEAAHRQSAKKEFPLSVKQFAPRLIDLLNIGSIGVTAKALDVLTEHERVFCGARILSDMRPVFLDDGTQATAAMIVHQLQIAFHEGKDHKELYFALDSNDLDELLEVIERARRKEKVFEKIMADAKLTHLKV